MPRKSKRVKIDGREIVVTTSTQPKRPKKQLELFPSYRSAGLLGYSEEYQRAQDATIEKWISESKHFQE